jgi:hypothetical protein
MKMQTTTTGVVPPINRHRSDYEVFVSLQSKIVSQGKTSQIVQALSKPYLRELQNRLLSTSGTRSTGIIKGSRLLNYVYDLC